MSQYAIRVEGISKQYQIGKRYQRPISMVDAVKQWAKTPVENFQRLRRIGQLHEGNEHIDQHMDEHVWVLKDVSFDVPHGQALGIIGRNGAGKSTLLKILARIVEPSQGRAELYGRVASLLEVGTGFHPDLTGRENIYLNGTLLGMTWREVDKRFDEIVAFSGIEQYLDTQSRYYSSGMRVRLAFSVAAHLEAEILFVDEVLAVGDIEFQERCLGKMQDVARSGRTVLFVSHSLGLIESLCERAIVLEHGRLLDDTDAATACRRYIEQYRNSPVAQTELQARRRGNGKLRVSHVQVVDIETGNVTNHVKAGQGFIVRIGYAVHQPVESPQFSLMLMTATGTRVFSVCSDDHGMATGHVDEAGVAEFSVEDITLAPGSYYCNIHVHENGIICDMVNNMLLIDVVSSRALAHGRAYDQSDGVIYARPSWRIYPATDPALFLR